MRSWQLNIYTCTYCVQHVQPRVVLVAQVGFNIMAENKPVLPCALSGHLSGRCAYCVACMCGSSGVEIHHQALSQCGEQHS